jgi:phosphoribosylaminoimidazolecarboxamide formyltransferase / IMP cyclohydrolase
MEVPVTPVRRALISVSQKTGLIDFAEALTRHNVDILSTGGTAASLRAAGICVQDVSEYTGSPEILDGRVKTLHPKIHGGLLAIRDKAEHREQMKKNGIENIDLVVVNLYPFRETAARTDAPFSEVVEQIDIGGPSMVRSAAKNHAYVAVVVDPADYPEIIREMDARNAEISAPMRFRLAQKAFAHTAAYDAAIASYMAEREWHESGIEKTGQRFPALDLLPLERPQTD